MGRHQIAVVFRIPHVNWDTPLEQCVSKPFLFNKQEASLIGARVSDYSNTLHIAVYNPNLPEISDAEVTPEIPAEKARIKFPYLFTEKTNPILYRVFDKWHV